MSNTTKVISFDWYIKKMLRDKSDYRVLEGFLTALFQKDIKVINILESEGNQEEKSSKYNRVDLLAEEEDGKKIVVEIQNTRESDYLERILFGTSKVIVDYLPIASEYKNIAKVISISILYFNLGAGNDYIYYGTTQFYGMNTGEELILKHRIENKFVVKPNVFPEYYIINVERFGEKIEKDIDEWIYMLKNSEIKKDFKSKYIKEAEKKMNLINLSPEEKKNYEQYITDKIIERDMINTAKEEGIEKGRREAAKKMIIKKEPADKIMEYLSLSKEDIDEIQKDINR